MDNGFPRPATQIPVPGRNGRTRYYLDMGWEDIMVAVEYDGEHHRKDTASYRKDIIQLEYIHLVGWIVIEKVTGNLDERISLAQARLSQRFIGDDQWHKFLR